FTNNGTYTGAGGTTTTFTGSALSVGGTGTTTVNNLTVNTSGTVALAANVGVAGNFTLTTGTFGLGQFSIDRTSAGGTFTLTAGTLRIGGNGTFPANYATTNIAAGTTVDYNGTGSQTIAPKNYANLSISSARTGANNVTFSSAAPINVSGNLS